MIYKIEVLVELPDEARPLPDNGDTLNVNTLAALADNSLLTSLAGRLTTGYDRLSVMSVATLDTPPAAPVEPAPEPEPEPANLAPLLTGRFVFPINDQTTVPDENTQ